MIDDRIKYYVDIGYTLLFVAPLISNTVLIYITYSMVLTVSLWALNAVTITIILSRLFIPIFERRKLKKLSQNGVECAITSIKVLPVYRKLLADSAKYGVFRIFCVQVDFVAPDGEESWAKTRKLVVWRGERADGVMIVHQHEPLAPQLAAKVYTDPDNLKKVAIDVSLST